MQLGDAKQFETGRDLAAWLGLTPLNKSSGGKERLGRITKKGDRYIRKLLIIGMTSRALTQSFNTATSMGRLTLNMLLSFAQFEREVTAESIRDKIAASKRKGLLMG